MKNKETESLPKGNYKKPEVVVKKKREIESEIWMDGFKEGFKEGFETGLSLELNVCRECVYKKESEFKEEKGEDPGIN